MTMQRGYLSMRSSPSPCTLPLHHHRPRAARSRQQNAHSHPRVRLRRLRRGVRPPPPPALHSLRYALFFADPGPTHIPAGHVLCANCCTTIVEKTNPRLSPVCPFCREPFAGDAMRVIRMDFATSGWTTPRRVPALEGLTDINSTLLQRKTANLFSGAGATRSRIEVRRLEDKVSRIAAKKCSVEEVNALYKELEEWLLAEKDEQVRLAFLPPRPPLWFFSLCGATLATPFPFSHFPRVPQKNNLPCADPCFLRPTRCSSAPPSCAPSS